MSSSPEISPLPTGHVLGYLTNTGTPTRVRQVAAAGVGWALRLYGLCLAFLGMGMLFDMLTWRGGFPWGWRSWQWVEMGDSLLDYALHYDPYMAFLDVTLLALLPAAYFIRSARVRRAVRLGGVSVCAFLFCACIAEYFVFFASHTLYITVPSWREVLEYLMEGNWTVALATFAFLLLFVGATACVGAIRRGRAWACILAMTELAPLLVVSVVGAALLVSYAVGLGFGIFRDTRVEPLYLLLIFPGALAALIGLVVLDMLRFLAWIGRNPDTEKPDTHIIPRPNRSTPSMPSSAGSAAR
ncbi:MAG TPA: hypothetical protein VHQ47_01730 [Phycisphaerae bacterium]|nr:hypothetical protein [Phycisphaerae bacterium]